MESIIDLMTPKTDSKYYAISVLEPEVCSAPYHVNIKNGAIYGSREGRFVVRESLKNNL